MQIVIDIPERTMEHILDTKETLSEVNDLIRRVARGIPLPKGHGRLFDERDIVCGNYKIIGNRIYELEPIIEADKESE